MKRNRKTDAYEDHICFRAALAMAAQHGGAVLMPVAKSSAQGMYKIVTLGDAKDPVAVAVALGETEAECTERVNAILAAGGFPTIKPAIMQ